MQKVLIKGENISKLSLGTVQLGMNYGVNNVSGQPSEEQAFEVLKTAVNGGVTCFDTASDYGTSERVVGDFFKKYKAKKTLIVTKFNVKKHGESIVPINEVESRIRTHVEKSLDLLGYNKLPLLLLHNQMEMFDYGDLVDKTLIKLQKEGLVDKVGVSLNGCTYTKNVLENDLYEAVQIPLNMMDVENVFHGGIDKLGEKGKIVFIRSVFLQGLFFKNPLELPSQGVLSRAKEPLIQLNKIAEEENISIAEMAISFIRDLKGVMSLVLGAENAEQVKENVKLIESKKLSEKIREKIVEAFKDVDRELLCPWLWYK